MKNFKKLVCFFLILTLVLTSLSVAHGTQADSQTGKNLRANQEPRIVKVGITDSIYFSEKQENGAYKGLLIDYLDEISKYAGWTLEYVEGDASTLLNSLSADEIDIMGALMKNDNSMSAYDFAEYASGSSYTVLYVLQGNNQYHSMDYNSFNGMRVGILRKASNRITAFSAFEDSNGLDMTPVYFDNFDSCYAALEKGEVDAIVGNDTSEHGNVKAIAKFGAVPYYFGVTKGKSDLLRELNAALATILEVNPEFDDMVYEKYVGGANQEFILSQREQDFIRNSGVLKVAMVSDLAPIEYYDDESGKMKGIAPDILHLISAKTGLKFELIQAPTLSAARDMVLSGQADLITGIYDNAIAKGDLGLVFTRSFLSAQLVTARNSALKDDPKRVVAMPAEYTCFASSPSLTVTYYDTMEDCIQAVVSGKATSTAFNSLVIDRYTYLRGNRQIKLTPSANTSDELSFGLAQPANVDLLAILDKAIYTLPTDDIQAIVYENTTTESAEITLLSLIYTYPVAFALILAGVGAISLITVLLLLLFMRTRLRLAQQSAMRGETYRIIGDLTDEYIFSYDFETLELIIPENFANLVGRKSRQVFKKGQKFDDELIETLLSSFQANGEDAGTTLEFQCLQSDGNTKWFRVVGTVQFDAEKKPIRGLGKIVNIQEDKEEKQMLEDKVNTDSLTGLFSRQYCEKLIMDYFEQGKPQCQGALMVMDLDYFKQTNDTLGHLAGDLVLQDFANTLSAEFRAEDIVGRWGGDEFIAFIPNASDEQAISARADRLCRLMHKEFCYEGKTLKLSISIGIAMTRNASSYSQLFQNADVALYAVKNYQRNGFKIN